ncbi:S41 family peptidase [Mangrovibacterium marinum]|uniref:Carboxyl-terminal processing protease n=1 Tax=Mangrovibacterium marinum TaxID=1639118 RepID=A0A2T5C2K4_9BACT|nr:S41 family peptidase [Mangrovibacterium marinum]PTN08956.1 carboxyl-terminal processing protease [Mangrovibacterium marinum]
MKKKINIYLPLLIALAIIGGIYLGNHLNSQAPRLGLPSLTAPKSNKLSMIIDLISNAYVDSVATGELVEEAIPTILKKLDPHSTYIPARDMQEVNEEMQGNFGGIGVQFTIYNDTVQVVDVISGGPSQKLGIQPGDRIVAVNDSLIAGNGVKNETVMNLLRGEKGTRVNVDIKRKGINDLIAYEITRGDIPIISVDVDYMINDSTGYVKVSRFAEKTYTEFMKAMTNVDALGAQQVIIDLRGNPGGYLMAVVKMVNEFLDEGDLIVYTEGHSQARKTYTATGKASWADKRIFVLIDEYSASASEIFTGALQDNDKGIIVGRRSFGKGLVQEQIPFTDGSALRLTVARYYTPSGRCIQKPYDEGTEEYYHDLMNRAVHGELEEADSIQFSDTLRYETKGGRIVYGGGGIMPDYFVPLDTTGYSDYYSKITQKALVYHFAFDYTDSHRAELEQLKTPQEIVNHLKGENVMDQFISYAATKGVKRSESGLSVSGKIIETQLMAYIARNAIGDEGFYPIIQQIDKTLRKAIELSGENQTLSQLLAVTK